MLLVKTIKVKVHKPTSIKQAFLHLLEENSRMLNSYVKLIDSENSTNKSLLHKLSYEQMKSNGMPTAIVQTARDKAIETYKSYKTRKAKNKKASLPSFSKNSPVRLDKRSFSIVVTDNKFKYFASVSTSKGRIHVPLLGLNYQYKYIEKLLNGEFSLGTTELVRKNKDFYFYITIKKDIEEQQADESYTPIGVDIGIINLSTSVILKDCKPQMIKFSSGRQAIAKRSNFSNFRQQLQKAKKLKRLKQTKDKEKRYMADLNHKISSEIIKQAMSVEKPVIVMEQLKYIREKIYKGRKLNRLLHNWNFYQLQSFIEYKAKWQDIPVVFVSPKYTSQKCSKCGFVAKANRKGKLFKCQQCSYCLNADLNAAINIAAAFKESFKETLPLCYMQEGKGYVTQPQTMSLRYGSPCL